MPGFLGWLSRRLSLHGSMSLASIRRLLRRDAEDEPEHHGILLATILLTLWLGIGTAGYVVLERWPVIDGLWMSFLTLTTIGFNEVQPLSTTGRLFSIAFAFIGIGTVAYVAARWASLLLAGNLIRERQRARIIRGMRDHYIVCGYGRIGRPLVADLREARRSVVVVEKSADLVRELREDDVPVVHGDATDEDTLLKAGISRASGLITGLPSDSVNVFVTLVARELNPDLFILARTNDERNRKKLIQAGAAHVVAPSNVGALRMTQVILRPYVDRFLSQVMKTDDLGMIMEEALVEPGSYLAGKTLQEARFRQHFDAIVVNVIKGDSMAMQFNPGPRDRIDGGDVLIVLGRHDMIERLRQEGCSAKVQAPSTLNQP